MASYSLKWKRSAEKELRQLPREVVLRLLDLADSLREIPFPPGAKKLAGTQHTYRVRTGDYRLIYEVQGSELIVQVIRVGHQREIYR